MTPARWERVVAVLGVVVLPVLNVALTLAVLIVVAS